MVSITSIEPYPEDWLTDERIDELDYLLRNSESLLKQSGLWRSVLAYWIRLQVSLDIDYLEVISESKLDILQEKWLSCNSLNDTGLSIRDLRIKLKTAPLVAHWSRKNWGQNLNSLYLQHKDLLDKVKCSILFVTDKNLAQELYHRIKSGEVPFRQASIEFGEVLEGVNIKELPMQSIGQLPYGLGPHLRCMKPGQVSVPLRQKNGFFILFLEKFVPSKLDFETEELLLREYFSKWVESVLDVLVHKLGSSAKILS